jgi:hypothetical protein
VSDLFCRNLNAGAWQYRTCSETPCGRPENAGESGLDKIDFSPIDANGTNGAINDAFTFIGNQAFGGVAGQLRVYDTADAQIIEGDVNGDGVADFAIEVAKNPFTLTLTAADFVL